MMAIRSFFSLLIALLILSCEKDTSETFSDSIGKFVRFNLQVNSNNSVIEAPIIELNKRSVSNYTKDNFNLLKIPVALTAKTITSDISVNFSAITENLKNVEITPAEKIVFTATKRVDTIYIKFNSLWNVADNPKIKLQLTSSSDPKVILGTPNNSSKDDKLIIDFDTFKFQYRLDSNTKSITEIKGENVIIDILFPKGYAVSDIENTTLFTEEIAEFDYNLKQLPLTNPNKVSYLFTLNEAITDHTKTFRTVLKLIDLEGYNLLGNQKITITKIKADDTRDNSINIAANFYNVADPLYRTFGKNWIDSNANGECRWRNFFAFTFPVVVSSNHPNAILFDDLGTPNTADDIYHHAFRIGFKGAFPNSITNPFNLRRWFTNESTSINNSPGLSIVEALEFFPANGTNENSGIVNVITQDLVISGTNGNSYIIAISGTGTYKKQASDLFEIEVTLRAENNVLFEGVRLAKYKIYNRHNDENIEDLGENCFQPVTL